MKRFVFAAGLTVGCLGSSPLHAQEPPSAAEPTAAATTTGPTEIAPRFPARFELRIAGGVAAKRLFGLPMTMGTIDLALGGRMAERMAFNVAIGSDFGRTTHGLTTRDFTLAPSVELVVERFRLGFGPEMIWFGVWRATTGAAIAHGGVGFRVAPSLDLFKTDSVSIFLAARAQADWLFAAALLSATGSAGVRF